MKRWTMIVIGGLVAMALSMPALAQAPAAGNAEKAGERREQRGKAVQNHLELVLGAWIGPGLRRRRKAPP